MQNIEIRRRKPPYLRELFYRLTAYYVCSRVDPGCSWYSCSAGETFNATLNVILAVCEWSYAQRIKSALPGVQLGLQGRISTLADWCGSAGG